MTRVVSRRHVKWRGHHTRYRTTNRTNRNRIMDSETIYSESIDAKEIDGLGEGAGLHVGEKVRGVGERERVVRV